MVATDAKGESETLATDAKHRWIDRVALGPDGAVAWAAGKQAFVRTGKGEVKSVDLPSSVGGLAFAPKGLRLAIAHYGGVTLWFPNAQAAPEMLAWKGSHLDVAFSPDGKFLVTSMQEATLHGWRLMDGKDMRMSGYSAKVRSMAFTAGGKWLATSGSEQLILWPFGSKDGPMGKQPRMVLPHDKRVVAVACHPLQEIVAAGFEDGMVMLAASRTAPRFWRRSRAARRSRRSPGARRARSSRSGPRTARPGSSTSPERPLAAARAGQVDLGPHQISVTSSGPLRRRARRGPSLRGAGSTSGCGRAARGPNSRAPRAACRPG